MYPVVPSMMHTVRRRVTGCAEAAVELLFPPSCACCAIDLPGIQRGMSLCDDCAERLCHPNVTMCRRCGSNVHENEDTQDGCRKCRRSAIRFDAVVALGDYSDELRRAVLRIKHPRDAPLARALAGLLYHGRRDALAQLAVDVVVPVPMHWARRALRGANSAETLAVRLSRQLGSPAAPAALRRRRNTKPQGSLPRRERFRNVRGALALSAGYYFNGARVMVVDDIMTTGATLAEAAKVLKTAGAAAVFAVVLARAGGPD